MNKENTPKIKTIQINYPAPYYHHSWSEDTEQKKKRLPKKLVSSYKARNEMFTARTGQAPTMPKNPVLTLEKAAKKLESMTNEVFTARTGQGPITPDNPILTLEKAAKKLESMTKEGHAAPHQRPRLERKKSPKKRENKNTNVILIKESLNNPKPRKKSPRPRPSSPHLKYGVFKKPPRMRGQTHIHMEKRRHTGTLPSSANSPVMMYRASLMPRLAVSEIVHLDIKPSQPSSHRGQGAAFSWRGTTKAS